MKRCLPIAALIAMLLTFSGVAQEMVGDAYPLDYCIVSGKKLGANPVVYSHEGRELRFCCKDCIGEFKKNPADYLSKVNLKIIADQMPFYPLTKCLVRTDEDLPQEPLDVVYQNRLVRFCCRRCSQTFAKDPAKYIAGLNKAVIAKQLPTYKPAICIVSKEKLGEDNEPVNFVFANRLIRFCCKGCIKKFRANPLQYLSLVNAPGKEDEKKECCDDHQ